MLRWLQLAAVCGVVLVWSNEAFALAQDTNAELTMPAGETGTATLTLNQPEKKTVIQVTRNKPRASEPVRVDPDRTKTIPGTLKTDKGEFSVTVDVEKLLAGSPQDLGGGFILRGTPVAARAPGRSIRIADNESRRPPNRGGYYMQPSGVNGASTFMPNFFFGFVGGASNLGSDGNGANLVSLDTFGGGSIVNTRTVNTPGPQGSLGFLGTAAFPLPMAANGAPMPTTFGVTSGMLFGSERDVTTSFSFAGTVPAGAGTVNIKDSAGTPLLFEFGFPVRPDVVLHLGAGPIFSSRETTIKVQETGFAGTPAFSRTVKQSFVDPAITAGLRLGVADLNNNGRKDVFVGARALVVFKQDGDPVVLQSPNAATQNYTINSNRGGTEASIFASLDVNLSDFFVYQQPYRGGVVSDLGLKRDITRVGQLESGLPLYRYKYLWSDQVYVGVMAQEVADVAPDAVVKGDDGYLRVNYVSLGTSMKTWEQWSAARGWLSREAN